MISEHLFFITERITDILELEKERVDECSDDERITESIHELYQELSCVVDYVKDVEQRSDEQQHDHDRFYLEFRVIANTSDDILNRVFSNDVVNDTYDGNDTASVINHLVERIRNCHHLLLPAGSIYNINTVGNTNLSGQQIIGSTTINIDPSHSRAPMINRISRPKTYGEYPDSDLVGFEQEIQTLLHHLTPDNETHVVGVVGMGGLGKTTLAKHIYHHPNIKTHFTRKTWVCISESWDKTRILKEIRYQVPSHGSYLVVLDDIWSIEAWYDISSAFLPWSSGSKVVVTSRNITVPKYIDRTVHIVEPKPLDDKESWELFKRKAFLPNENISHVLLQLGKEMVKKCEGLPLAVVALAGVLGMDKRPCNWERVSKALTHTILKEKNESTQGVVKEVLALSYRELPHHIKQCVLYLRLFPADYKINARNLIKIWIAEGLINTTEDQESIAEEYLDEIVRRYIVKVVKTDYMGRVCKIRIHDLIRQMFVDIDKERGFLRDSLRLACSTTPYGDEHNCNFSSMLRSEPIANVERVFLLERSSHIRSLIFLKHSNLSAYVLRSMLVRFRLLRVLILHDNPFRTEVIGNLIHLRYFELWGGVVRFPEYIGNLRNLRTLNLRYIAWKQIEAIEINLCKLKELRHLYMPDYCRVHTEKLKLETLEKLKTLWSVQGGEWMTGLSAYLEELRVFCRSKKQLEAVSRIPSITWDKLQTLELDWHRRSYGSVKLCDMNFLSECKSLKKLKLCGQIEASTETIFPPKLIKLEMKHTCLENIQVMNIISESCPDLEILNFGFWAFVGKELVCNANSFPKLVKLTLENLGNLEVWRIENTAMPSLHHLTIRGCDNLTLTHDISRIQQLVCE